MKKYLCMFLLVVNMMIIISGCNNSVEFADKTWTRTTDVDTEYISFLSDGSFSYYCACGDPVNDSDLCTGYKYNSKENKIELKYSESTDNMITTIIVKSCSDNTLELDFDGDIRTFSLAD